MGTKTAAPTSRNLSELSGAAASLDSEYAGDHVRVKVDPQSGEAHNEEPKRGEEELQVLVVGKPVPDPLRKFACKASISMKVRYRPSFPRARIELVQVLHQPSFPDNKILIVSI